MQLQIAVITEDVHQFEQIKERLINASSMITIDLCSVVPEKPYDVYIITPNEETISDICKTEQDKQIFIFDKNDLPANLFKPLIKIGTEGIIEKIDLSCAGGQLLIASINKLESVKNKFDNLQKRINQLTN